MFFELRDFNGGRFGDDNFGDEDCTVLGGADISGREVTWLQTVEKELLSYRKASLTEVGIEDNSPHIVVSKTSCLCSSSGTPAVAGDGCCSTMMS